MSTSSRQASAPVPITTTSPAQPQAAAEVPEGTIRSEALVPTVGPPYEEPLDLRCLLHWTTNTNLWFKEVTFEEGSPEAEAQEDAQEEMWNFTIRPQKVRLWLRTAQGMTHYRERSPPFFAVLIDEEVDWAEIHDFVLFTIEKHFGRLEKCGYGRLLVRYIWRERSWDEDVDF